MKRLAIFSVLGPASLMLAASPASADDALPPMPGWMDTTDALNPVGLVQGSGIKVGEGTVLQPQVGIETGVVSNVFYEST
ncbi:MAG TPA: hypothetical protein VK607_02945, partial [Kofleriaceae bacterium]|nr:hypothetical protein [Kofleriaceae bacterium]